MIPLKIKTVVFSDGTKIKVSEANWIINTKIVRMEEEAENNPLPDPDAQRFHLFVYPKLFAPSSGDVPTEEEAMNMPEDDLNKWREAVEELIPRWYSLPTGEKQSDDADPSAKKKGRKRG